MSKDQGTREFKNSLFIDYFTDEEKLIEIYSAIMDEKVSPDAEVKINTLSDVLFKGLQNDVSFLLDGRLVVLIEHQSSINANMPLRMLQYYVETIKRNIIGDDNNAIYKEKLLKIPRPEFIVLYNGRADSPSQVQLKLSDAFEVGKTKEQMELTVTVYNINPGYNEEILARSDSLKGYSYFIGKIHECLNEGMSREDAIKRAIIYSREHDIMQDYLPEREGEIMNLLTAEWNLDDAIRVHGEEQFEDGIEKGIEKEKLDVARGMKSKDYTAADIAEITGLSVEEIEKL
jgi:predicted transposase/invertase (TIGR01784 family)